MQLLQRRCCTTSIEDTDATRAEIDQMFGPEIGGLVDGLTKIKRLDLDVEKSRAGRKLPQTADRDFERHSRAAGQARRPLTQHAHARAQQAREQASAIPKRRSTFTRRLAGLMGMQSLREELEDHSFRWLHPEAYRGGHRKAGSTSAPATKGWSKKSAKRLARKLSDAGIKAEDIGAREKALLHLEQDGTSADQPRAIVRYLSHSE